MSSTTGETRTGIPGPFYWILNEVADAWKEFRYADRNGKARQLGGMEFAIYHLLCRWADNGTRECRRFQCDIGEQFNISPNSLRAYLRNLEGAKLICMARGRIIGHSLTCAPTTFKLLDIKEALRHGESLKGDNPEMPEQPSDPCANSADACANSDGACANSAGERANIDGACANSAGVYANSDTNIILIQDSDKTEEEVCRGTRDDTASSFSSSSSDDNLPEALREERGRFPRVGELAAWCGEHFGRAAFPAETAAPELEHFEQALARLDGLLRQHGQTGVEAVITRLSLRPEVREQFLAAKNPASVLGRQLNYAVEDFSARLGDQPVPVSRLPVVSPAGPKNGKPDWLSQEKWDLYLEQKRKEAEQGIDIENASPAALMRRGIITWEQL